MKLEEKELRRNGKAVAGMTLGIVGIVSPLIGLVIGIIGIVFSALALKEIREEMQGGRQIAITGLITSVMAVVMNGILISLTLFIYGIVKEIINYFESIF